MADIYDASEYCLYVRSQLINGLFYGRLQHTESIGKHI